MSQTSKTPLGAADRVKDNVSARQCEPHIQEDGHARHRRKRDNRSTSRGRSRGRSSYDARYVLVATDRAQFTPPGRT